MEFAFSHLVSFGSSSHDSCVPVIG